MSNEGKQSHLVKLLAVLAAAVMAAAWLFPYSPEFGITPRLGTAAPADVWSISRGSPEGLRVSAMLDFYYPKIHSQGFEELFVRDFFQDKRGGVFLDVGASHYKERSTTYYIDRHLGWSGIAVDPIAEYRADYEQHRPRTKYFSVYAGDRSDADIDFHVVESNLRLSSSSSLVAADQEHETIQVKTITLNDLLASEGIERIDLLSMDIELAEPEALRGFDVERYRPQLVVIETHGPVRDSVFEYFTQHGYVDLTRYSDCDKRNSYFAPRDVAKRMAERTELWESYDSALRDRGTLAAAGGAYR